MIKKPEDLNFSDQKFSMIIYGSPGVGKTTLALSAPNPVLIDFDRGISRVRAQHRKATIVCDTYEEVLKDLESDDIKAFDTIIVDTGGSFVTFLQDWAMRINPAINKQKNGAISLKGFGAVKSEFTRFTGYVKDVLHKNIIYVFHSQEQTDKDGNAQQRLLCEGAAKNIVWTPCDFGGYVQMIGNRRVICFTPEQEFFAKGCHGISGQIAIPQLGETEQNDFLTQLFERAKANIQAESEALAPKKAGYEEVMAKVKEIIDGVVDAETATAAANSIPSLGHVLTSKKEASSMLQKKTKQLGLKWDKVLKAYYAEPAKEEK
jgi:hypothetical protein